MELFKNFQGTKLKSKLRAKARQNAEEVPECADDQSFCLDFFGDFFHQGKKLRLRGSGLIQK